MQACSSYFWSKFGPNPFSSCGEIRLNAKIPIACGRIFIRKLKGISSKNLKRRTIEKSRIPLVVHLAKKEGLTIRQLAGRYGGYSGLAFVGTAETVADEMERWLEEDASDGFTVTFPFLPEGLEAVTQKLVPELQRRGLFRQEYQGTTLREHLGLPRPVNRFF